jgi:glucose-1-phosphate cytidylyltransferase
MRLCAHHRLREFVIATGYEAEQIERYFRDRDGDDESSWSVEVEDTGEGTFTGGRVRRLRAHLDGGTFLLAWCDGLTDLDLSQLLEFHRSHGHLVTVTAVHPRSRFGHLELDEDKVTRFTEKAYATDEWVSGGFFAVEPGAFDYLEADDSDWDVDVLPRLAAEGELMAYRHAGFWRCLDTPEEAASLDAEWRAGAPWKVWD